MRKILIGVAVLAAGTVIVFGARKGLREHARATPQVEERSVSAPAEVPIAVGVPAPGGEHRPAATGREEPAMAAEGASRAAGVSEPAPGTGGSMATAKAGPAPPQPTRPAGAPAASPADEPATREPEREPGEQAPELETVLRRAAAAYSRANTLQADFAQRSTNPILRKTVSSRGTLYQRRPDRFLMKFSDPEGDLIVSDGSHFWVYYPSVDRKQVIRMPASSGAGGVDLQAQFVGDPLERFVATYEGREAVAGRDAYVLVLTPREALGYQRLKVWIDVQDYLVRRFEVTEDNGVVRHFELSNLRINPKLADDLFRFEQPEGTHIVDRG